MLVFSDKIFPRIWEKILIEGGKKKKKKSDMHKGKKKFKIAAFSSFSFVFFLSVFKNEWIPESFFFFFFFFLKVSQLNVFFEIPFFNIIGEYYFFSFNLI